MAVALGALEGGVVGVILKQLFAGTFSGRALNYSVALLIGAPHFCNLVSFLWARLADGRDVLRLLFRVQVATALCLVLVAAAPRSAAGLPMMLAGALGARLLWSGIVTLRAPVWRRMYPRETRARLTGRFFSLHAVVMAATALAVGSALDASSSAYHLVYTVAAALGIGGALVFRGLGVSEAGLGAEESRPARESATGTRTSWEILSQDRPFARYLFWLSLVHGGNLMLMGPLIAIMSDHLYLPQGQQMLVTTSIPLLLIPFVMPLWSRLFDRGYVLRFQALSSGAFALAILMLAAGAISGRIFWLWVGAVVLGIAYAGGSVGWHLGTHHYTPRGRTLQYMGLHVSLSGIRGLLAPLAGMTLYEIIEASAPGHGAWALIVPLVLCAFGTLGFARLAAAEDRIPTRKPRARPITVVAGGLWRRSRAAVVRAGMVIVLLGLAMRGLGAPIPSGANGYLLYCPCMGRLGNQVAQLVGTLEVARASGRTLVLPPFIDYKRSGTHFIPFGEIFDLEAVRQLVPAVTMAEFLSDPDLETRWPATERRLYCPRRGDTPSCKMPAGNPHETFWDHFGIEFTDSLAASTSSAGLVAELPASEHPVIALGSAPGRFPVAPENRHFQRYLVWNEAIRRRGEDFIAEHLPRPFVAVHLRTGDDWKTACRVGQGGPQQAQYMSSPQCGLVSSPVPGAGAEPAPNIPERVCYPDPAEAVRAIQAAEERFGPFRAVFIGTDRHDYRQQIEAAVGDGVRVVRGDTPTLDLTVFGQADLFIGNCVSSFSALAVRERRATGRPSVFFGFSEWTEHNAYLGEGIAFDD